jgi:uncharacterized protein (TIGR04222 family)
MIEGLGPFDLKGPEFLVLYGLLFVVAVIAGIAIPRWLKPAGTTGSLTDPDQAAYLAGSEQRFAETVVARLLAERAVELVGKSLTIVAPDAGRTKGELAVLRLSSPAPWSAVSGALHAPAQALKARLEERGLLMRGPEIARMRLYQTLPYALLLCCGVAKWMVGVSRNKPVSILTFVLVATAIVALMRYAVVDRQTRAGRAALANAQERESRLKLAPMSQETGMAVALFGTSVLVGSDLWDFHRMRASTSSSGGDSSSDSGSSDGGCGGGGGCGGCS